ncbi:MAG: TonB-dependent receptor, partial [Flavobacteriales bacterium]|nr:TonB-dependent receptor [Flavobacteriales bacterium]
SEEEAHEEEELTHEEPDGLWDVVEPYQYIRTHTATSENTWYLNKSTIRAVAGYISNRRQEFEAHHHHEEEPETEESGEHPALDMLLNTVSLNARWHSPEERSFRLITGLQGSLQDNANFGEEILIPDAQTVDAGGFLVASTGGEEEILWQSGVRYDMRSLNANQPDGSFSADYANVSFQSGVSSRLTESLRVQAGIASGFRPPVLTELLADGEHHGTFRYMIGNTELKPERSYQMDLSIQTSFRQFELTLAPFLNRVIGYIYQQPTNETIDDLPVYHYVQDDVTLMGGEWSVHFHPLNSNALHVEIDQSLIIAQRDRGGLVNDVPGQQTRATLRAEFFSDGGKFRKLGVYATTVWSVMPELSQSNAQLVSDYFLLHSGMSVEVPWLTSGAVVSVNVRNLFDRRYADVLSRYRSVGFYDQGRNVQLSLMVPVGFRSQQQP